MPQPYDNRRTYGHRYSRFLDTVGDKTGSIEANVNGSVTPVDFKVTVPEAHVLLIDRIVVYVRDTGTLDADKYGNGLALTNGIVGGGSDPTGTFIPRTEQLPIKANSDWAAFGFNMRYYSQGTGDEIMVVEYSYVADGTPLRVPGGFSYTVRVNDNLTGLTGHRFYIGAVLCPSS